MNDLVVVKFKGQRQRKFRHLLVSRDELEARIKRIKEYYISPYISVIDDHNIVKYEPNSRTDLHKTDCVIRAYSKYFNQDYDYLTKTLRAMYPAGTYKKVHNVLKYMSKIKGLTLIKLDEGRTLNEILEAGDDKKFLILQSSHLVAAENGKIYDNGAQALGLENVGIAIGDEDINDYILSLGKIAEWSDFKLYR